jgi:hypothetical protein
VEAFTIGSPLAGGWSAGAAGAALIGLAVLVAAGWGRLTAAHRRRRAGRADGRAVLASMSAPLVLIAMLGLQLAFLSLGGDPFERGDAAGGTLLAAGFGGFALGVKRQTELKGARRTRRGASKGMSHGRRS